jgi:hypothetical protein
LGAVVDACDFCILCGIPGAEIAGWLPPDWVLSFLEAGAEG